MPKKSSVMKRINIAARNRHRNKIYKSIIKTLSKKFYFRLNASQAPHDYSQLSIDLSYIYSCIDKATKKGVFHPNYSARKKSSLARALSQITIN